MKSYIFLLFFVVQYSVCFAQPKGIHISWNGEKKVNTSQTMAITWMHDMAEKGEVIYGIDSNHLNKIIKAKEKYVADLHSYISKVTLKKLKPSTFYYYKVGSPKKGYSSVYKFRTAPLTGNENKIVIGLWSDTQNNKGNYDFEQTDTIVQQMSKHSFDFTVHNGDIVENGSVEKSWKGFFNIGQPLNARYPLMSVTGNHDVVNDTLSPDFQKPFPIFYELFNLPKNQLNYSYDYGNTHFIAINSGYAQGAEKVGKVLFEPGSKDYKWLESDLSKARKNKNIKWIILYCHYPMHAFGVSKIITWQQHITPLLDKYNVDLCISGHRHVYERHKPVKGTQIFELENLHVYDQPQGTVYITNGSAGGSLQGVGGSNLSTMAFTPKINSYNYAIMSIEGNVIDYNVYDKSGNLIDYFKIIKRGKSK
jgi:predicted phosphodiesterase